LVCSCAMILPGPASPPQGVLTYNEKTAEKEKDHVKDLLREQITEVINELGLVTKADLEALKKDLKTK